MVLNNTDYNLDSKTFFRKITGENPESYLSQKGGEKNYFHRNELTPIDERFQVITNLNEPIDEWREKINIPVLFKKPGRKNWKPGYIKDFNETNEGKIIAKIYADGGNKVMESIWYNLNKNIADPLGESQIAYTPSFGYFNMLFDSAYDHPLVYPLMSNEILILEELPKKIQEPTVLLD